MNNKKEIEREELHKTIWKIANELRGSVDGWDFKQYVLGLLFYRFISENIENYVNENQRKAGIEDFKYRDISDEEALLGKTQILEEKGLFILPSELFCNVRKNADKNENLNVVISNIFNNIESSASGLLFAKYIAAGKTPWSSAIFDATAILSIFLISPIF